MLVEYIFGLLLFESRGECPNAGTLRLMSDFQDARMYVPFANIGLPLQPRFRTVRTIKRFLVHPAVSSRKLPLS